MEMSDRVFANSIALQHGIRERHRIEVDICRPLIDFSKTTVKQKHPRIYYLPSPIKTA